MTISSIGTSSRTYSTITAWEAASPANLVTSTDTWEGELYNDSEFIGTFNIAGITADATYNVQLRCASGESFKDHADAATNALTYNVSKGVGIRNTTANTTALTVSVGYTTIDGLQINNDVNIYSCIFANNTSGGITVSDCILKNSDDAGGGYYVLTTTAGVVNTYINLLLEQHNSYRAVYSGGAAHKYVNCTMVAANDDGAMGFQAISNSPVLENCCSFGYTTDYSGTFGTSTNNASDGTGSPGSNPQDSLTFADQFEDSTGDFRLKSGSSLEGNGVQSSETNDLDIIGQDRDTSTPDIGCWEFQSVAGGGISLPLLGVG